MSEENVPNTGEAEAAAPEQPAEENQEGRQVPLSALEAERTQRQQLQDELKMMKEHLNLLSARQQQAPKEPEQPEYDDNDVMTFGDFKKVAGQFQSQISGKLTELEMMQKYPDYSDVVRKYLPKVLSESPELRSDFESNPNYYRAYWMAKNSEAYRKDHTNTQVSQEAQKIVENSEKSGSLSSIGGASSMNQARRWRDMSDEEFMKEAAKNRGYA